MKTLSTLIVGSLMAVGSFAAQAPVETKTPAPATSTKAKTHKKNHKKAVKTAKPAVATPATAPVK